MSRLIQPTTNGLTRMDVLHHSPIGEQFLPSSPPQISPKRMREIATAKRGEAQALERHTSRHQDGEDRNTRSAQGFTAQRAAQLRAEVDALERQAQEAEQETTP